MTQLRMKTHNNMSRKELEEFKVMEDLNDHPEKITLDHPLVKREYDRQMADLKALEPERKKIMERLERYKSKKILDKIKEVCNQGLAEWEDVENLKWSRYFFFHSISYHRHHDLISNISAIFCTELHI